MLRPSPSRAGRGAGPATTGVGTAGELSAALMVDGTVILEADITVGDDGPQLRVGLSREVTIDLNGHRLEAHTDDKPAAAIWVSDLSDFTIDDTAGGGSIEASSIDGAVIGGGSSDSVGTIRIRGTRRPTGRGSNRRRTTSRGPIRRRATGGRSIR